MSTELQEALAASLKRYSELPMLRKLAAQSRLVPPEGKPGSPLMLVGEAPGETEERLLRPFVGKAGHVLDAVLRKTDLRRDLACWVTNTVLFRPPGNRTPYPFEIQVSRPRLEEELLICMPIAVIALGATAWHAIEPWAELDGSYAEVRGKPQELTLTYKGTPMLTSRLLVTWHPSATFHQKEAESEMVAHIREFMS